MDGSSPYPQTTICVKLRVIGIVQGVFYRKTTCQKANELSLKGYVKNLTDGSVECVVQGPKQQVKLLIDCCKKGSPMAKVSDVSVHPLPLDHRLHHATSFQIV